MSTVTDNLATYLLERLDEDEQVARAASEPFLQGDRTGLDDLHPQVRMHALRWNTGRVLAEVAAKRRIVEDYRVTVSVCRRESGRLGLDDPWLEKMRAVRGAFRSAVVALAQPYADRGDFRAEWKL